MELLKKILHILLPIGLLFNFDENDYLLDDSDDVKINNINTKGNGKKVKLVTRYPLNIGLTKGKTYDVVEKITAYKPLKRIDLPIQLAEIINDNGEVVLVTLALFEDV